MIEWCVKYWNILAGLALFGIAILVCIRGQKKMQREALSQPNHYPNQMPENADNDIDDIQKTLLASSNEEPPIKLVQGTSYIDIPILKTSGEKSLQLWRDLRSAVEITGFYPVILGDRNELETAVDRLDNATETIENSLLAAQTIDVKKWFRKRVASDPDYYNVSDGEWPEDTSGLNDFSSNLGDFRKQPLPEVFLALVPTKSSWEAPVYLQIGGSNNIPLPEENVAILKYWNDLYGAELVAVQSATFELLVAHPPTQKRVALQLAKEHIAFCRDVFSEQTLGEIGAMLRKSKVWFFWWD